MPEGAKLRVVLADDEPLGRASVRELLAADAEVELVAECANGAQTLLAVRTHAPDLLFLDVQMPGLTGIDVVEELTEEERPTVVFVTAYDRYALRAFDVHAVDYLLKPFDDDRFRVALQRAKERHRARRQANGEGLSRLVEQLAGERAAAEALSAPGEATAERMISPDGGKRRIVIRGEGRTTFVDVDDLVWIEAADQYVKLHTASEELLMRGSMSQLERELEGEEFFRVHRSAIVRLSAIKLLESQGAGGRARLKDGNWLPVSRTRIAALRRRLG